MFKRIQRLPRYEGALAVPTFPDFGVAAESRGTRQALDGRTAVNDGLLGGAGLWIDHRKAVVVAVALGGVHTTLVLSGVDKQPGRIAGRRSTTRFESQQVPADDCRDRRFAGRLGCFYDAVIACLRRHSAILIFGPGEAKGELRRRLAANKHDHREFRYETMGRMTGPQIAAKTMDWLTSGSVGVPPMRRRSGRPVR